MKKLLKTILAAFPLSVYRLAIYLTVNLKKNNKTVENNKLISQFFKLLAHKISNEKSIIPDIKYLVYYGDKNSHSHFNIWNPIFEKYGYGFASIVRYSKAWQNMYSSKNIFPVSNVSQIGILLERMPNLTAIFYPANNGLNLQIVRYSKYNHIFLGHGDSFKAAIANKIFRLYDEVWVAGERHISRFNDEPGNYSSIKFKKVGQPWLVDFLKIVKRNSIKSKSNIGYFPTWAGYYHGESYSSLDCFDWVVAACEQFRQHENSRLICKFHPWTGKGVQKKLRTTIEHFSWVEFLDMSTSLSHALLKDLSIAICDNSASVTEALHLNIPIFVYLAPEANYSNFQNLSEFCYLFSNFKELCNLFESVLINNNDAKKSLRKKILSDLVDIRAMETNEFGRQLSRFT